MDSIAHLLWTFVLSKFIPEVNPYWLMFFAVIPDFPLIPYTFRALKLYFKGWSKEKIRSTLTPLEKKLYHTTHSYLVLAFLTLMLFFVKPDLVIPLILGWGLMHITVDIFLHGTGLSVNPFYPVTNYEVHGLITWYTNKVFFILNYVFMIIATGLVILFG